MNRRERQNAILRLVRDRALSTQAELVQALRDEGHDVVQTTVSRDVTELGLVKVRAPSGRLIYAASGTGDADRLRAIGAAMRRYATGVEAASSGLVVVTTPSGYASALAQAIDEGAHPSIAGTLAGDNTIFIAAKDGTTARELQAELAVVPRRRSHAVTLWSGRVGGSLDPSVWAFLHADDAELLPYDCEASLQHARRLHGAGLLSDDELAEVEAASRRDRARPGRVPRRGRGRPQRDRAAARRPSAGRSMPAGRATTRSRRRSASTCSTRAPRRGEEIEALALVVLTFAEAEADTLLPGYTHLQRGQPVTLGHHLLAWVEMLDRDRSRFAAAAAASTESPLGAGALAGSTLGLPGPPGQMRNSIDAVADRDFALDYLYAVDRPLHPPLADRRGDRAVVVGRVRLRRGCPRTPPRARR